MYRPADRNSSRAVAPGFGMNSSPPCEQSSTTEDRYVADITCREYSSCRIRGVSSLAHIRSGTSLIVDFDVIELPIYIEFNARVFDAPSKSLAALNSLTMKEIWKYASDRLHHDMSLCDSSTAVSACLTAITSAYEKCKSNHGGGSSNIRREKKGNATDDLTGPQLDDTIRMEVHRQLGGGDLNVITTGNRQYLASLVPCEPTHNRLMTNESIPIPNHHPMHSNATWDRIPGSREVHDDPAWRTLIAFSISSSSSSSSSSAHKEGAARYGVIEQSSTKLHITLTPTLVAHTLSISSGVVCTQYC
jgi:hypothetical protein